MYRYPMLMFCLFYGMKKKSGNFPAARKKRKKEEKKKKKNPTTTTTPLDCGIFHFTESVNSRDFFNSEAHSGVTAGGGDKGQSAPRHFLKFLLPYTRKREARKKGEMEKEGRKIEKRRWKIQNGRWKVRRGPFFFLFCFVLFLFLFVLFFVFVCFFFSKPLKFVLGQPK